MHQVSIKCPGGGGLSNVQINAGGFY